VNGVITGSGASGAIGWFVSGAENRRRARCLLRLKNNMRRAIPTSAKSSPTTIPAMAPVGIACFVVRTTAGEDGPPDAAPAEAAGLVSLGLGLGADDFVGAGIDGEAPLRGLPIKVGEPLLEVAVEVWDRPLGDWGSPLEVGEPLLGVTAVEPGAVALGLCTAAARLKPHPHIAGGMFGSWNA